MNFCQKFSVVVGRRMSLAVHGFGYQSQPLTTLSRQQSLTWLRPRHQLNPTLHRSLPATSQGQTAFSLPQNDPQKGSLVYVGTLARMVRLVKVFSLSTSAVGISLQPFLLEQMSNLHWILATMVGGIAGFFVFITPILLHIVTKRYVTAIYLNRDSATFTASTYSFLLREKLHAFKAEDVKIPNVPGIFTTVRIRDKVPLFIDPNLFIDQEAYIHMMKYDQPLDWEMPEKSDDDIPPQQK